MPASPVPPRPAPPIPREILARPLDARIPATPGAPRTASGPGTGPSAAPDSPDGFDIRLGTGGSRAPAPVAASRSAAREAEPDATAPPLSPSEVALYLERIGYRGRTDPTLDTLSRLHRAHLMAVPFENLDIMRGAPIVLDEGSLFEKIVRRRRGGFCYELNGLFAMLLRSLGFRVALLSARVARNDGTVGPEFDHLLLRVRLDEPVIADVGFGDAFTLPMPMRDSAVTVEAAGSFRLINDGGLWNLERLDADGAWVRQYVFTTLERALGDFAEMCDFHQTSPLSHFTRRGICTRLTHTGRITISDSRLIELDHGVRTVRPLEGTVETESMLRELFGI